MGTFTQQAVLTDFGDPTKILLMERELPPLVPDEVRVRIESATVSATDTVIRKGLYPLLKSKPPFTLGYDLVGYVEAVGNAVTGIVIGDRVANISQIGGNATHINLTGH